MQTVRLLISGLFFRMTGISIFGRPHHILQGTAVYTFDKTGVSAHHRPEKKAQIVEVSVFLR